jgi:probable H4MPT-linked C1 transfer pathway protein
LLIDVGSTTCDLVPLINGGVANLGQTDTQRLLAHELVYTGVERTPVCALVDLLPYRQSRCPVARELFATTLDVYLLLSEIAEDETNCTTADGQPATKQAAGLRLARCLCADQDEFDAADAVCAAQAVADAQANCLAAAIDTVCQRHQGLPHVILSGHGDFLTRRALELLLLDVERTCVSLRELLGPNVSRCASAHALAVLAAEACS